MSNERIVRTVAGLFIIITVLLAHWVDERWLFVTLFVGANLFQSGITRFCPLEIILNKYRKNNC